MNCITFALVSVWTAASTRAKFPFPRVCWVSTYRPMHLTCLDPEALLWLPLWLCSDEGRGGTCWSGRAPFVPWVMFMGFEWLQAVCTSENSCLSFVTPLQSVNYKYRFDVAAKKYSSRKPSCSIELDVCTATISQFQLICTLYCNAYS